MGLNETPSGERIHIGFFGRRNAGKSSVVNAFTSQQLSIVSDVLGTTTDPVYKAMELLPMGPVMIIDTPGYDDEGELGKMRVKKTKQILNRADIAVIIIDAMQGKKAADDELIALFEKKQIPYIIAYNKCDLINQADLKLNKHEIAISALNGDNIEELKNRVAALSKLEDGGPKIISDLINTADFIVLVTPIDSSAPKGRLILPQQQTIRDILDAGAVAVVTKEFQLEQTLKDIGKKPTMVVTDSQAFEMVSKLTPMEIPLTSFSILMARHKGFLEEAIKGVKAIDELNDGDTVLISEGCTHHRQCEDIGTVKIPSWLRQYTGKDIIIETSSGREFPDNLEKYKVIIHCGGCMLNEREIKYRMKCANDAGVPFTNYGTTIAKMKGILKRSIAIFKDLSELLEE